jgi:hypothetical protein
MYEWAIVNWRDKEEYRFWDGSKISSSYSGWVSIDEAKIYSYTEMACFNLPDDGAWVPIEMLGDIMASQTFNKLNDYGTRRWIEVS